MKKKMKRGIVAVLNLAVFYALFMGIAASNSWKFHDDYMELAEPLVKLYDSEEDWEKNESSNVDATGGTSSSLNIEYTNGEWHIKRGVYSSGSLGHEELVLFVDAVNAAGYSTWNSPRYKALIKGTINNKEYVELENALDFTTPPEHRMLVVTSVDDMKNYSKTWVVEKVEANKTTNGADYEDVTNDPEFDHYSDNTYTFFKATKFTINAGTKLSGEEQDLFGSTASESTTVKQYTGTYLIEELNGTKQLKISVANSIHKDFTLLDSSYSTMTLSYDNEKSTFTQNVKIVLKLK